MRELVAQMKDTRDFSWSNRSRCVIVFFLCSTLRVRGSFIDCILLSLPDSALVYSSTFFYVFCKLLIVWLSQRLIASISSGKTPLIVQSDSVKNVEELSIGLAANCSGLPLGLPLSLLIAPLAAILSDL